MNSPLDPAPLREIACNEALSAKVLFISEDSAWGKRGYEMVRAAFRSVLPVYWSSGTPKPDLSSWQGDWIISFKSDLVLPHVVLEHAKKGSINFHPSPPKYRGIGGYWWALHNGDAVFGVTCHHMDEHIDHGAIIKTESFPISPRETVENLRDRAAIRSLMLLQETLDVILSGKPLTPCGAKWGQHLYTHQELIKAQKMQATNNNYLRYLSNQRMLQEQPHKLWKQWQRNTLPLGRKKALMRP